MQLRIQEKAAGVFLWVVLVVDILNREYQRGAMALEKRFSELPSDLSNLFRNILRRDQGNSTHRSSEELLLCILWILYAERPLTPQEYDHALWSGLHPKGLVDLGLPDTVSRFYNGSIERYIISSSKGLAELTRSVTPIVQFIHESVRDFLIKDNGLSALWPGLGLDSFNQESLGHEKLKVCCWQYVDHYLTESSNGRDCSLGPPILLVSKGDDLSKHAFLEYAAHNILYHANFAAVTFSQSGFLSDFPLSAWASTVNYVEKVKTRHYRRDVGLMYVLADRGCPELIKTKPSPYEACLGARSEERLRYPFFAALANGNITTVVALLGLSTNIWNGVDITKDLRGHKHVNSYDKKSTPLSWAARWGLADLARLLLQRGAPLDEKDLNNDTPLEQAAKHMEVTVAKVLIEAGANLLIKPTRPGWTLLRGAMRSHDEEFIKYLMNAYKRIEIDSWDFGSGDTPLYMASGIASEATVKLLLDMGANPNARSSNKSTPVHQALRRSRDYLTVLRLLIKAGADTELKDDTGLTSLFRACEAGDT